MGRFSLNEADGTVLVKLDAEIVLDRLHDLRQEVNLFLSTHPHQTVVADLSEVTFMDSSGISFLISLRKQAEDAGRRAILKNPSPPIAKLLQMLRLNEFFDIIETTEQAAPQG